MLGVRVTTRRQGMSDTYALITELDAIRYSQRGLHELGFRMFMQAGEAYLEAGLPCKAALCFEQAEAENRWIHKTGPVNVSGLVD